jgi:hypothetical protein
VQFDEEVEVERPLLYSSIRERPTSGRAAKGSSKPNPCGNGAPRSAGRLGDPANCAAPRFSIRKRIEAACVEQLSGMSCDNVKSHSINLINSSLVNPDCLITLVLHKLSFINFG